MISLDRGEGKLGKINYLTGKREESARGEKERDFLCQELLRENLVPLSKEKEQEGAWNRGARPLGKSLSYKSPPSQE